MPRFRVDPSTTEEDLIEAIGHLRDASHAIDAMTPCRNYWSTERAARDLARNGIHAEIERLTGIIALRRSRVSA